MKGEIWLDAPALGSWNMAMDLAMMKYAHATHQILMRIYRWSQPTVSLGYFQSFDDFTALVQVESLDCVRRMTGGGAILHDREWTYSLAIPGQPQHKGHSEQLYRAVHRGMVEWLGESGHTAQFWEEVNFAERSTYSRKDSFWCFERRSDVDVVVKDQKVLGSAQRRSALGLLQHGSLVVDASPALPRIQGLSVRKPEGSTSRNPGSITADEIANVLQNAIDSLYVTRWRKEKPDEQVLIMAERIANERFSSDAWTKLRISPLGKPFGL